MAEATPLLSRDINGRPHPSGVNSSITSSSAIGAGSSRVDSRLDSTRSSTSVEATFEHHLNSGSTASTSVSLSDRLYKTISSTQRERALRDLGVGPAVFLIREAVQGEKNTPYEAWYDPYAYPNQQFRNLVALVCGRLLANVWLWRFFLAVAWMLVVLSFIEPPHWCRNVDIENIEVDDDDNINNSQYGSCWILLQMTGTAVDGSEDVQYYPNFNAMILTVNQSRKVELACLIIIAIFTMIEFGQYGLSLQRFFYPGFNRRMHTFRLALIVTEFVTICTRQTLFNSFLRLLLLGSYLRRFHRELASLIRMVSFMHFLCRRKEWKTIFVALTATSKFHSSHPLSLSLFRFHNCYISCCCLQL